MALPPSLLLEARDAVQWVRARYGCTGEQADSTIQDWVDSGALPIEWLGEPPPIRPLSEDLDWFRGTCTRGSRRLPRSYLEDGPQEYGSSERVYHFTIRRKALEEAAEIAEGSATVQKPPAAIAEAAGDKTRRGRSEAPHWSEIKPKAMEWLDEEGAPARGDGGQAALERFVTDRLVEKGHNPSESTVRDHVKRWIAEFEEKRRGSS
jgi:hypothetical protein